MSNAFFDGSRVRAAGVSERGARRYEGEIQPRWNLRPLPQGGIVTALALRAMAAELDDPAQSLRALHTSFVAQVTHGPVQIDVDVLRRGRSMSHLRADLRNLDAAAGHETVGIFGAPREGFTFVDLDPPRDLPLPRDCPSMREPPPEGVPAMEPMPFWEEVIEGRPAIGHAPWDEYTPDSAERAYWYRFDESPFTANGALDPFALVVLADTMPGAVGERVGPQDRMWFSPSVDLTVHILDECRSEWVLAHNLARHASDGYASVDMALWDCGPDCRAEPRLVAYATQVCLFTFFDGPGA